MKFEIVHLSDFHIRNEFDYDCLISKMIDSLIFENGDIDSKIFLCITGDLAYSGQKKQFDLFDSFLKKFKNSLEHYNRTLEILFVPGNHDIQLPSDEVDSRMNKIRNALDNKSVDDLLNQEIKNMTHFFNFSKNYDIFLDNKYVCVKEYNLNNRKIKFVLLNTACFSSIKKNDKDMHYIYPNYLENVNEDEDTITLLHHNFEWFDESCQQSVEKVCKSSAFYLFGHNHKTETIKYEKGIGFLGTEIKNKKLKESAFSILLLDTEQNNLHFYKVEYDQYEKKFVRKEENKVIYRNILHDSQLNHEYKDMNSKIEINGKDYLLEDFFVMPLLTINDNKETISTFEELLDFIENKKIISFDGITGRGKTTLVKKVFNAFIDKYKFVLFVNKEGLITNNYDKSIKNIFEDNYKKRSFDSFLQSLTNDKVLIVDNININKENIKKFIDKSKKNFEIVIFTYDGSFDTRKEFLSENLFIELQKIRIEPYTLKQRSLLIEKLSKYYNQEEKCDLINRCLESILIDETYLDLSSPDNLLILIQRIIEDKLYEERDMKDSFSIVFESNIFNKIKCVTGDGKIEDAFTILREMAYFMFNKEKKECYKISTSEILEVINNCRDEWGIKYDEFKFLSFLNSSGLMKKYDESYSFIKNSYFAYFIAKGIIERANNEINISGDLEKIIKNISFGNYSDVLLFIAYFYNSYSFFKKIMETVSRTTSDWVEISYDENNHYILKRIIKEGTLLSDNYENKENHDKRKDSIERKHIQKIEKESDEIKYSSNEINNDINDIIKTIKLLEILSKGLGGYRGKIKIVQRNEMFNTIIDGLYKLIYKIFDFSDEDYESFYKEITSKIKEKNNDIISTEIEKKITNILYDFISTFTLNLLTSIANIFVSKNSISLVDKLNNYDDKGNIIFNNVLLKCICYERYGQEDKFIDYVDKIYDNLKSSDHKRMIRRVFYLFAITNVLSHQQLDKICNKLGLKKDEILLLNQNNKNITAMLPKTIKV